MTTEEELAEAKREIARLEKENDKLRDSVNAVRQEYLQRVLALEGLSISALR